jgi:hypothetical protein
VITGDVVGRRLELGGVDCDDITMLGFWALVIWGVTTLVRGTGGIAAGRARDVEDILAERFARGEIAEHEFRDRGDVLRERRLPSPRSDAR